MHACTADEHRTLFPAARWEHHAFSLGPLRQVLMHVVTDQCTSSVGQGGGRVRTCVRLMLADGSLAGLMLSGPLALLWPILHSAAATLSDTHRAVADFNSLSATLAADAVGMRIALEHDARVLPSPLVTAGQVVRLQQRIGLHVSRKPLALTAWMAAQFACEHGWRHPAVGAWLSALDPAALAYGYDETASVHGVARSSLAVYNFLVGRKAAYCLERAQALSVLPWLLPMLTTVSGPVGREVRQVCHAIDARQPLFQAVANAFEVPRETVRWLGRAALPADWKLDPQRLRGLLALLSWLPVKWRPGTTAQFETLIALGNVVAAPLEFDDASGCRPATLRVRRAASMRRWLAEAARPGVVAKRPGGLPVLTRDAANAADFLRALLGGAIAQMPGCSEVTCAHWVVEWSAGISLYRLLALSQQWHAAALALAGNGNDDEDGAVQGRQEWPAVLPQSWHFEDRTVVELTSSSALLAEGRALQHCVAGYGDRCQRLDSMIVSVRDADGWPCSTAELHLTQQGVTAGQHRAIANTTPEDRCERAIAALLLSLNGADGGALLQRRMAFQRAQAERHDREHIAARQPLDGVARHAAELAWHLALA